MPVEFLIETGQRRYGRYTDDPSPLQLARYFHLDDRDRRLIAHRRRDHNRLGFAIQLRTVRFLGTFLPDPTEVPANVISNAAHQLNIHDPSCLAEYCMRETHWDHAAEIKQAYSYPRFSRAKRGVSFEVVAGCGRCRNRVWHQHLYARRRLRCFAVCKNCSTV